MSYNTNRTQTGQKPTSDLLAVDRFGNNPLEAAEAIRCWALREGIRPQNFPDLSVRPRQHVVEKTRITVTVTHTSIRTIE